MSLSIFEKREQFSLIKSEFYNYVVNVPIPWDAEHIVFDSEPELHFYVSKLEAPSKCYSYETGKFRSNTGYEPINETSKFF